jgi:hypothetical protein
VNNNGRLRRWGRGRGVNDNGIVGEGRGLAGRRAADAVVVEEESISSRSNRRSAAATAEAAAVFLRSAIAAC